MTGPSLDSRLCGRGKLLLPNDGLLHRSSEPRVHALVIVVSSMSGLNEAKQAVRFIGNACGEK